MRRFCDYHEFRCTSKHRCHNSIVVLENTTADWWLVAGGWWVIVGVIQYDWPHVPTNTPAARDQPHFYPSQEYLISSIYLLYDFHPWILLSASIVCTSLAAADAGAGCPWLPRPGRQVTPDTVMVPGEEEIQRQHHISTIRRIIAL